VLFRSGVSGRGVVLFFFSPPSTASHLVCLAVQSAAPGKSRQHEIDRARHAHKSGVTGLGGQGSCSIPGGTDAGGLGVCLVTAEMTLFPARLGRPRATCGGDLQSPHYLL